MKVSIDVGYYNLDPAAPCPSLAGITANVDYRGRLSLCCNLSGYRGSGSDGDIVADLNEVSFATAWQDFKNAADAQLERRRAAIESFQASGKAPDVYVGSPCLFCLQSYGKLPWKGSASVSGEPESHRSLPVMV